MIRFTPLLLAVALLLSACGTTTDERAMSGAALAAGPGAAVGAAAEGLSAAGGAFTGAGLGAAIGAATGAGALDLGPAVSRLLHPSAWAETPAGAPATYPALVRRVQAGLSRLGYNPGPANGRLTARTRAALARYQRAHDMPADGIPTRSVLADIEARLAASRPRARAEQR